ncbi:MAG TPA: twin transmembrane helix small protein [Roseomonas sp.]|nr:twin transmembrane helix small protein [Roseomonas sp.]
MQTFLSILLGIAMLATFGVMMAGVVGTVRGGANGARSNRLMRWRIGLQGLSILLFLALMLSMGR